MRRSGVRALAAAALLPLVAACNEDPGVFTTVGTTRVFFTDPLLASQSVKDSELPVQVAEWSVSQAVLDVGGTPVDLLAGSTVCKIVDTVIVAPQSSDKCNGGLVVETRSAVPTTLRLRFTMSVQRARPVVLPPLGDYDADGVPNADDTCPLLANPGQALDPCSLTDPRTGSLITDSDGDGIGDPSDNCLAVSNPAQADTTGPTRSDGVRVPDLIGDACEAQVATVDVAGSTEIELVSAPLDYAQAQYQLAYWVVDLSNPDTLTARCAITAEPMC